MTDTTATPSATIGAILDQVAEGSLTPAEADAALARVAGPRRTHFSVDDVVTMAASGVSPEYVRALREAGLDDLTPNEVIGLCANGVEVALVRDLRAAGRAPSMPELIGLALNGIDAAYVATLAAARVDVSPGELISLGANRVPASYVVEARTVDADVAIGEVVALHHAGIGQDALREAGAPPSVRSRGSAAAAGAPADDIRALLDAAGLDSTEG